RPPAIDVRLTLGGAVPDRAVAFDRDPHRARIAADGPAVTMQDRELVLEALGATVVVPPVGELGHHPHGNALAGRADPQRRVRALQRLGLVDGVGDRPLRPRYGGALLRPHRLQNARGVGHAVEAAADAAEPVAVGVELVLLPAGAQSDVDA